MDVRLRLSNLEAGDRFTFICSPGQEARMAKVIARRNGRIDERRPEEAGIVLTVSKKPISLMPAVKSKVQEIRSDGVVFIKKEKINWENASSV